MHSALMRPALRALKHCKKQPVLWAKMNLATRGEINKMVKRSVTYMIGLNGNWSKKARCLAHLRLPGGAAFLTMLGF